MHPGSGTAPAASGVRNKESLMRRSSSRQLGLLAAAVLSLAACSPKDAPPPAGPPADTLEGALDIVAWPGYIERGASDKNHDWVTPFEQDTGCKLSVKTAGTSDEMVSLMSRG